MKYALTLGNVAGIKISVHWTFLILITWVVFMNVQADLGLYDIIWSVGFILTVFGCVILHELGHALAAKRYNVQTKSITLLPIGGLAQLESVPEKPREELIIALAGPAVNIVIVLAMLPFVSVPDYDTENAALATIGSGNFLFALMVVNLWLALFNLIPAFPMDGGRVFRALLSFRLGHVKATRIAASFGQALAIGFVFLGFVYNPFLIFIGLFIFIGAQAEAVEVESKALLHGFTVKDVLMQQVPAIGHHLTIKDAARRLLDGQNKNFVVMDGSTPVGTLSRDEIIKGLQHYDPEMLVDKIKDGNLESLPEDMPLKEAWTKIRQQKKPLMLVFSSGQLQGVVDEENIAEFLLIRSAQRKNTLEQ